MLLPRRPDANFAWWPRWFGTPSRRIALQTAAMVLLGIALRFGLGLESTRDTRVVGQFTYGIRIHHGYIGLAMLLVSRWIVRDSKWRVPLVEIGTALVLSDLIHHFLVLWPITGSPQFDFVYR